MTFIDASAPIATHAAVKQNVHGVGANDIADIADISTHAAMTQNVHGVGANDIADVADISTHAAVTTNIHGTGAGNVIVGHDELSGRIKIAEGSYTGNNSANRAIPHGLGITPQFIYITSSHGNFSHQVLNGAIISSTNHESSYQGSITTADATNFYVGNAANYSMSANGSSYTYYWTVMA